MVDRIKITKTCYMQLDGQWQIVQPGTVADVADATIFSAISSTLSPGEAASAALPAHGKPTTVRDKRTG